jgi:HKD family nuclease
LNTSVLTGAKVAATLISLISECEQFDVAVAWATLNPVVDAMLKYHSKIGHVVIGTHMYQTDPAVLRKFMPRKAVRCLPPNGDLFHPKVYFFRMGERVVAIVGSHNLTNGAFGGKNIEASVLLEGLPKDKSFIELSSFIKSKWKLAEEINEEKFLFAYETQYRANKERRKALDKFQRMKMPLPGVISGANLSWDEFVKGVKNDHHHSLDGRLKVLERASELFQSYKSFASMPIDVRRAIAGTYGSKEPKLDYLQWAWFGSMIGQGDFKNLVNDHPSRLSKAMQHIPIDGDVSKEDFDKFVHEFNRAFEDKAHKGGVPTATRLLAMKRPDIFVGVNKANRAGICKAFGAAPSTLNLKNYWERIIIPAQNSPWWLHARPKDPLTQRIWDNRAALMDGIYYDPSAKG